MDKTLTEIFELAMSGQASSDQMRELLDSLTGRELKFIEWPLRELMRQVTLAQVRGGTQGAP